MMILTRYDIYDGDKNVSSHALYMYIEEYIDVHGPVFFNFRKITAKLLHYCIIWKLCNKSYGFRWHINVLLIQVMECGAKYFHTHGRKTYPAFTLLEYLLIFKLYLSVNGQWYYKRTINHIQVMKIIFQWIDNSFTLRRMS